jgi:diketogulonate reductase-like aldo/keto reductase
MNVCAQRVRGSRERIAENFACLEFTLSDAAMARLSTRPQRVRYVDPQRIWGIDVFGEAGTGPR